jgi:hypothetical protein
VSLKQFLHFLELFLALKINSKKNYPTGLGRARGPDPNSPAQPSARTGPSEPGLRPEAEAAMALPPLLLACAPDIPWGPRLI